MADLFARIKPKKSSAPGEVPSAADLEVSELAVNTADGKLFTKHTDNTIKTIGGGGGVTSIIAGTNVTIDPSGGTGDVTINAAGGGASNIVDQGDYSPRYESGAPTWSMRLRSVVSDPANLAAGECNINTPFYIYWSVRKVDHNGVDRSAALAGLQQNDVLTFTYNGGANSVQKTIGDTITEYANYWSFKVNNSSEPWTDGELVEVTGGTLTADPIEIVKATGDLLTWNDITGKFEPTPAPASAVTSVNGQAGAVVLDLLDINDVTGLDETVYRYNNFVNSSANVNSSGKYYRAGFVSPEREVVTVYSTDADGNNIFSQVAGATTGSDIWWKSDTVTTWQQSTLYSNASGSNPGSCSFTINEPPAVTTGGIGVGSIYLTFANPSAAVYDTQVLTWHGSSNLWKPAYPRIQGADDFRLQGVDGASWTVSTSAANSTGSGMITANGYQTTTGVRIHPTSIEGDQKANLRAWIATLTLPMDITFVFDGVEKVYNVTAITDEADLGPAAYQPRFIFTATVADAQDSFVGQTLVIKEYDTYLGAGDFPLAVGDFLRWDGTDFRPVQGITLATLQSEVAASTDFADFQARIAAL